MAATDDRRWHGAPDPLRQRALDAAIERLTMEDAAMSVEDVRALQFEVAGSPTALLDSTVRLATVRALEVLAVALTEREDMRSQAAEVPQPSDEAKRQVFENVAAPEDRYGFAKRRIDRVRAVELIEVTTAEGSGEGDDPMRVVARFYTAEGAHLATGAPVN